MKEPFVDVNTLIDQTQILSDMELQSYLASLAANGKKASFTNDNVNNAISRVRDEKNQQIMNMSDKITGANNSITSAAYYLARTQDLNNMASSVDTMAAKQINVTDINKQLANRQYEINEWSNENKLDTLFFMQILFITLMFISSLVFLRSRDIIPPMLFFILTSVASLGALFVLLARARYTNVLRDSRYWHRARFPSMPNQFPNAAASGSCPPV